MKSICIIIPAHLDSVRLKRKILCDIEGLPMIEHVRRRLNLLDNKVDVFIATPDVEIKNTIEKNGGNVILTGKNHINGTSRVIEAAKNLNYDFYLIVQGDEPLLIPNEVDKLITYIKKHNPNVVNVVTNITDIDDLNDKNTVKCFVNNKQNIQLFFRNTPFDIDIERQNKYIKKVQGYIGIDSKTIKEIESYNQNTFVDDISIEQLIYNIEGIEIKAFEFKNNLPTVNTEKDLKDVRLILQNNQSQKKILKKIKKVLDI